MSNSPPTLSADLPSIAPQTTLQVLIAALQRGGEIPIPRTQLYFKSSLTALSHAMEDQLLSLDDGQPLVIATFQQERFYRQEARRYERIASHSDQVYVMAAPDTSFAPPALNPPALNPPALNPSGIYETVAFNPDDPLTQEWNLVVIGDGYASCLICEERGQAKRSEDGRIWHIDPSRRFEGFWTFDRQISQAAAGLLLSRIECYRPSWEPKLPWPASD
ncbi:MAG: hypothetical protein HC824_11830 [Synechococcales cyanobacterium RM1_1_8]|nr:hypothetical protein [Synechococcales cyanobacterium RM1_1_8]